MAATSLKNFSSEKSFHTFVDKELNKIGFFFKKEALSIRGLPDEVGLANGRFVALELKKNLAETRKKTGRIVLQRYRLEQVCKAGGFGKLVCPETWDETYRELCAHCKVDPLEESYLGSQP